MLREENDTGGGLGLRLWVRDHRRAGTASGRLQAESAEHSWRAVSVRVPGQPGDVPGRGAGRAKSAGAARAGVRYDESRRWIVVRDDHAAGGWFSLLHTVDRRCRGRRSGDEDLLRIGLLQQRDRGPRADRRCRLLQPEGRAPRHCASAVVLLQGDRNLAPRLCLYAAGLRRQHEDEVSGALPAARLGRKRAGLARSGTRRRDHGQPHRREEGEAHDRRHGQPQCGEARRERSLVLRARSPDAGSTRATARRPAPPLPDARQVPAAAAEARWPAACSPR